MEQSVAEAMARESYDRMAEVYTEHVAKEALFPSLAISGLELFAHNVQQSGPGPVADVGCGPGHITAFLDELGLDVFGVDISPGLLDIARSNHPEIRFEIGQLAALPVETDALQAVVSKHSLIHTPANLVPAVLSEFVRVLAPGGRLFLSFFGAENPGSHGRGFDHAVTTAYEFDVDTMAGLMAGAGLIEEARTIGQPKKDQRQLPYISFYARSAKD